jgi:hypothetical protein
MNHVHIYHVCVQITPWVMVMSHYPFYHTTLEENAEMSADWYVSPEAEEYVGQNARKFKPCENGRSCRTVRELVGSVRDVLMPIFHQYGVDFCEYSALCHLVLADALPLTHVTMSTYMSRVTVRQCWACSRLHR